MKRLEEMTVLTLAMAVLDIRTWRKSCSRMLNIGGLPKDECEWFIREAENISGLGLAHKVDNIISESGVDDHKLTVYINDRVGELLEGGEDDKEHERVRD